MKVDEAAATLTGAGYVVEEQARLPNDAGWQLKLVSGQVVNVFDTGKCYVQGRDPGGVQEVLAAGPGTPGRRVFVVYGHDRTALTELEAMLRRWQLEPLILSQLPSKGDTVIEKLERYQKDVAFGVVLATPDDEGHRRGKPDKKLFRVRQNVVLELGMLLASPSLGRQRVAILLKKEHEERDDMEPPSDIDGLLYIAFRNRVDDAGTELAREMAKQGIAIAVENL